MDGRSSPPPPVDALQARTLVETSDWARWLDQVGARGMIGEFGIPNNRDTSYWTRCVDQFLSVCDWSGIWTTAWAAGPTWNSGNHYNLAVYANPDGGSAGITRSWPGSTAYERWFGSVNARHGVNVAGLEWGADLAATAAADAAFLASRGVRTVRLPFAWERVQPTLGTALNATEMARLNAVIAAYGAAGIGVIPDLHNYARYNGVAMVTSSSTSVDVADLKDAWGRLSDQWWQNPHVIAYDLMNEPHDLAAEGALSGVRVWEAMTQAMVTHLRTVKHDDTLLLIPGYDWSKLSSWGGWHNQGGWITDPANNYRYEAHIYWDEVGGRPGIYNASYGDERSNAEEHGYVGARITV